MWEMKLHKSPFSSYWKVKHPKHGFFYVEDIDYDEIYALTMLLREANEN